MGVTSQRKLPNFTSPGSSDRTHWVSGIGQDILLSGCLGASRLAAFGDKDPDSGGQIRAHCGRTMDYDCGSHIRGHNGGSSMADSISCGLIIVVMADPVWRWHHIIVVDHDRGRLLMMDPNKQQWTMTVDYSGSDLDGGS
ncbi:unnamed protein product [Pleuronectes platessa]|uniref:Uncharacterized protein n=1 Tax=Pleuronectes platessa TaxID=8262 RepID=A0A9N7TXH3_PLEPL|nr:unnamed protein product [Pleuronectes platessa]